MILLQSIAALILTKLVGRGLCSIIGILVNFEVMSRNE